MRTQDVAQVEAFRDAQADNGRDDFGGSWDTAILWGSITRSGMA
jgi:hypothetical protein